MRTFFVLFLSILSPLLLAQQASEIFLMDISFSKHGQLEISNFKNVSNNEGYDNQPSFMGPNNLLYSGTRGSATDIAVHNLPSGQNWWLNTPTDGGEYSPQIIPQQQAVAAVRLDPDGLQRLYKYPFGEKPSELIFDELQVAYFAFYDPNTIMAAVLSNDNLDLVLSNLKTQQIDTLVRGVGRSIHKVPNRNTMSYTVKNEAGNYDIYWFEMDEKESYFICELPIGIQDYAWINEDKMILGSNAQLYVYDTLENDTWKKVADLKKYKITDISRITLNNEGSKLAIAGTSNALKNEAVVSKQVASYNARDLDGFASCFAEDVSVRLFPNEEWYNSRATLRANYQDYYDQVSETSVEVTQRIALNGFVIDAETANDNGQTKKQVAIYQVNNGEIKTMTFLFDKSLDFDPEVIVDKQLEAYNARDIDAFVATYAEDVALFNYPDTPTTSGRDGLRNGYTAFFEQTPDLHCEIKNRIVIGNWVIDEEYVTMNGTYFKAIAIYEVEKDAITKVTFIR